MEVATECSITQQKSGLLTDAQAQSIHLLQTGMSVTEVAKKVGKDRATLYRWRDNPWYMAELNKLRAERRESDSSRIERLQSMALMVVEAQLREGSLNAALSILKLHGFNPSTIGPTEAYDIVAQQADELAARYMFNKSAQAVKMFASNPSYRRLAQELTEKMAAEYGVTLPDISKYAG